MKKIGAGNTIIVRCAGKTFPEDSYPIGTHPTAVKILKEYEKFYTGIVLPHKHSLGLAVSVPYSVTISKVDVLIGEVMITEAGGKNDT